MSGARRRRQPQTQHSRLPAWSNPLFSQTAEYALRAVAHLATQREHASTISAVAEATQVGAPYLRKVLDRLRDADIVATQRGSGGGVRLIQSPEELTILDIVNAVDPIKRVERCPLGLPGHMQLCPLHSELDEAISQVTDALSRRTIAELMKSRRSKNRCDFPREEQIIEL